jgi:hypothetical protein
MIIMQKATMTVFTCRWRQTELFLWEHWITKAVVPVSKTQEVGDPFFKKLQKLHPNYFDTSPKQNSF